MNKSESIAELAKALCKVQSGLKPAAKSALNPHFKKNYADLNSIWDACREALTANNLAVTQITGMGPEGTVIIETVLLHTSGEWISGELMLPLQRNDAQGVGSALTYGRRYGLAAILGVVADEDDDGHSASHKPKPQAAKPQPIKAVKPADPREADVQTIMGLCKQLNEAGDSIVWKSGTLKEYINEFFEVTDGVQSLAGDSFGTFIEHLKGRLADLETEKKLDAAAA